MSLDAIFEQSVEAYRINAQPFLDEMEQFLAKCATLSLGEFTNTEALWTHVMLYRLRRLLMINNNVSPATVEDNIKRSKKYLGPYKVNARYKGFALPAQAMPKGF